MREKLFPFEVLFLFVTQGLFDHKRAIPALLGLLAGVFLALTIGALAGSHHNECIKGYSNPERGGDDGECEEWISVSGPDYGAAAVWGSLTVVFLLSGTLRIDEDARG